LDESVKCGGPEGTDFELPGASDDGVLAGAQE
jgi:hypothetical protein